MAKLYSDKLSAKKANFSFKISSALPNPSIKPSSFALDPDQNSPVNKSRFLSFFNSCLERHEIYNKDYLLEKIKTELSYLIHSYKNTLDLNEDDFSFIRKIIQSDESEFIQHIQKFNSELSKKYNIFLRDKNIFHIENIKISEDYYYKENIPQKNIEKIFYYQDLHSKIVLPLGFITLKLPESSRNRFRTILLDQEMDFEKKTPDNIYFL